MSCRGWRGGWLVILVLAAVAALGQSRPLNPTVTVLPRAVAPVPPECDFGPGVPPPPPMTAAQVPIERSVEEDLKAPPSRDLRGLLRQAQEGAERNDRDAFREASAGAKALLANYPTGTEKSVATDVGAVYSDLQRLWDYQFDAPTGSFFDAATQGGALLQMLNKYPGYADFIAGQTITAGGNKIYPTRESRDFLTTEAARRLTRLGIESPARRQPPRTTTPPPQTTTPPRTATTEPSEDTTRALPSVVPRRRPAPTTPPSTSGAIPRVQPRTTTTTPRPAVSHPKLSTKKSSTATTARKQKPSTKTAQVTPPTPAPRTVQPSPPTRIPTPTPITRPAPAPPTDDELSSLPPGVVTTNTVAPAPAPVTPVPAPATQTTMTQPAATTTEAATQTTVTTETLTPETTTAAEGEAATPQPAQTRGPNFIIPLILILIGIGVLIVLFRASS